MQATIEREAILVTARRRAGVEAIAHETSRPYRAPLATFLALVAAGRAAAARDEGDETLDALSAADARSAN